MSLLKKKKLMRVLADRSMSNFPRNLHPICEISTEGKRFTQKATLLCILFFFVIILIYWIFSKFTWSALNKLSYNQPRSSNNEMENREKLINTKPSPLPMVLYRVSTD